MSTLGASTYITTNDVSKIYLVVPTRKLSIPDYYRVKFDEYSQPKLEPISQEDFLGIKEHNTTLTRCSNEDLVNALECLLLSLKLFERAHHGIKSLETKDTRMR